MTISATTQGARPGVCTSTNRPANPYDGMMIYETDTNILAVYNGSSWVTVGDTDFTPFGVWTDFTPTWAQSATITKTTTWCKYLQMGKTVFYQGYLVATSAGTASNVITISVPVTPASQYSSSYNTVGSGQFVDVTPGYYTYSGTVNLANSSLSFTTLGTAANLLGVNPAVTVASTDIISWSVMYEAA